MKHNIFYYLYAKNQMDDEVVHHIFYYLHATLSF